ncbi:acireductone synthase [Micromonospora sp. NPDC048947]|uniref:acireductone synthase n=1 Tax=Micromonospora sp. NPDC048947 TaxID=3154826 RepID=UPI0033C45B29
MSRADAVVLDVEGTLGSLAFVRDVLFPYSRERVATFLERDTTDVQDVLRATAALAGKPTATRAELVVVINGWIDQDVKAPPLKALQGMIWADGYASGALTAHVFDDVPTALRTWRADGLGVHLFSSGSVQAQHDWLRHTELGDLRPLVDRLFDAQGMGAKTDPAAYQRISREIGVAADRILFASDRPVELAAARAAGWHTLGVHRPGNPPTDFGAHAWVTDFSSVRPQPVGRPT